MSETPAEGEQHDPRVRSSTRYYCSGQGMDPGCGREFFDREEAEEHVENCEKAGGLGS